MPVLNAKNGNVSAFFELPIKSQMACALNAPKWVRRIPSKAKVRDEPIAFNNHLEANGVEVLGVTDHSIDCAIYILVMSTNTGSNSLAPTRKKRLCWPGWTR